MKSLKQRCSKQIEAEGQCLITPQASKIPKELLVQLCSRREDFSTKEDSLHPPEILSPALVFMQHNIKPQNKPENTGIYQAREQLCGKGLGVLVDKLNLREQRTSATENQQDAGLHLQECHHQKQRSCYPSPTPLSTCQATPEILCSVWVPAIQKQCGQAGKGPVKGHN